MAEGGRRQEGDLRATLPSNIIDIVFKWSLDDIYDQALFRDEITEIPLTFQSVSNYLGSYVFPLLEEVREDLCQGMEAVSGAPFSEILTICKGNSSASDIYDVRVQPWRNKGNGLEEDYRPLPGDIFIFSNMNPEVVSDLKRFGKKFLLASVTQVHEDGEPLTNFRVKISRKIMEYDGMGESLFAVFLLNMTTYGRVWKALGAGNSIGIDLGMIKEVICTNQQFKTGAYDSCKTNPGICANLTCSPELNQFQEAAVLESIAEIQCSHKSTLKLIWGPPGTGKTKTISELVWMSMSMKYTVVTCAPTITSIKEIASRFLDLVKRKRQDGIQVSALSCPLGDILLLGNNRRYKILANDELLDIFLDHRVDRLIQCFSPLSGWRFRISSIMDFLTGYVTEYDMHIQLEKENVDKEKGNEEYVVENTSTTLPEFFRQRLQVLASPLLLYLEDLCTHMPLSFLSERRIHIFNNLICVLSEFERLISTTNISDKELESSLKICVPCDQDEYNKLSDLREIPNPIHRSRMKCLNILRLIQNDIPVPTFYEKYKVREFCLDSAMVVFCTAATSFKMRKIKSFDLLVIDEASQLKECESAIPMQLDGIQHVVLIGDEHQLPATVKSKVSKELGFGRSLFERLGLLGYPKHLLQMQYRMHPCISSFPNRTFYSSLILDASHVTCRSYEKSFLPGRMYGPFSFINVADGREELIEIGYSRRNTVEAAVVLQIVRNLFKVRGSNGEKISIGIISPYDAQVALISGKIGKTYDMQGGFTVRVKSIDGFQGGEEDVIIISTVRSNVKGSIGFLSDHQRANVALTRARHCLWIIGNSTTLTKSGSVWASLIHDAESRKCFFNADEDESLSKAIVKSMEDLDHLDYLLNRDSIMFRSAIWKVLFSDNFKKSFAQLKAKSTKRAVMNFLLKLSEGWRPKESSADAEAGRTELVRQFRVQGIYVVWTTDIMRFSEYTQVLKIWDILPLNEIPSLVKRLKNIFATYTDDYICRCKAKSIKGKLKVPVTWSRAVDVTQYKHPRRISSSDAEYDTFDSNTYAENSKVSDSLILMKFYALSLGVANHLLSGCDGQELHLPFEVTDEERDVIMFPRSTFILGRSGTGKTTVLTTKLVQREQLYHISSEDFHDPQTYFSVPITKIRKVEHDTKPGTPEVLRQLFVTVSPKLCRAISSHIFQMRSLIASGETTVSTRSTDMYDIGDSTRDFADLPDNFSDLNANYYPLIITFQKFLMMLDGSVGNSFFSRFQDLQQLPLDERGYWRFPVFHAFMRHREVDYDRFTSVYWPHFNVQLTKKLDCSIVYKEIISHIKGTVTNEPIEEVLCRDKYVSLSENRSSTLDRKSRNAIFDIFLDYERKKCANGDFDISDFVIDIHLRLRLGGGYIGDIMDYVYIDEVQDLTMKQIALFKYASRHATDGFVFAGDTAQTIARGIDFRFQDIRSLFYTEFLQSADDRVKQSSLCNLFHLKQNFRTHAGILKLGQNVIDLLYSFFPQSIDRLGPENSLIYGEAPVLLESKDENAIVTIFGSCGNNTYSGFGAEQVILVRDDISKEEILPHIGNRALVLTIIECKGLEFQDVLLYNFFGSSPLKNQWRVIYGYMESQSLLDQMAHYQCFDRSKHSVLCSELKYLYVAITRTRQRLWICETKEEYAKPIFDYWKKLCLVQSRQLDDNLVRSMHVASSREEWKDRGTKLFHEGNYEMATMCFERAGDVHRENWSRAAGLRASGNRLLQSNYTMGCNALTQAAAIFEAIGKADASAECYIQLGDYQKAGLLYFEKCGESFLEEAGDCFFQAGCWSTAAEVYGKIKSVSKCLTSCSEGKLFDLGLQFIECWRKDGSSLEGHARTAEVENSFLERCAVYHHSLNDTVNMMRFVRGLSSVEHIRSFLMVHGYLEQMMLIENDYGNFEEAAEIARKKGDILFESKMLEKMAHYEQAAKLVLFYVFTNSLWFSGNRAWSPISFPGMETLLERAVSLSQNVSDSFFHAVQLEVDILAENNNSLEKLAECLLWARTFENFKAEFFATQKILDLQFKCEPSEFDFLADGVRPILNDSSKIPSCQLSVASFVNIWNLWRESTAKILTCLTSLETDSSVNFIECESFCFEYFGARKNESGKIIILNSEACWIRETNCKIYCKTKDSVYVEDRHFLTAAHKYWTSELFSVGLKVEEKLQILLKFSMTKPFPQFIQGFILLNYFLVTRFLLDLNTSNNKKFEYIQKMDFIKKYFWQSFFPLDWRKSIAKEMVQLRESDAANDLTKLVIMWNMNPSNMCLTHGKIGRVAVLLFGIKNFEDDLNTLLVTSFPQGTFWHSFIKLFVERKEPGFRPVSLVSALKDALGSTFNLNWRMEKDYISPSCFLYLVERLLYLLSHSQEICFTSMSTFIEGMNYPGWNSLGGASLVSVQDHDTLASGFELVAYISRQLLFGWADTVQWIRRSGFHVSVAEYVRLFVPRLVIMVGLLYLNCRRHFELLEQLLCMPHVISALPGYFIANLKKANRKNFLDTFSDALKLIQDPLVIIGSQKQVEKLKILNAIVINKDVAKGKEQVLDVLFPKVERWMDKVGFQMPSGFQTPANPQLHHESYCYQTEPSKPNKLASGCSSGEIDISTVKLYKEILPTLEVWQSDNNNFKVNGVFTLVMPEIKVKVQNFIHMFSEVLGGLNQVVNPHDLEATTDLSAMIDGLKQLCNIFNLSDEERAERMTTTEELLSNVCRRMTKLKTFLDSLILPPPTEEDEKADPLFPNDSATKVVDDEQKKPSQSKHQKKKSQKRKGKKK